MRQKLSDGSLKPLAEEKISQPNRRLMRFWSLFGCYGTTDVFVEVNRSGDGHGEVNLNLIDNCMRMNGAPLSVFNTLW